MCGVFVAVEGEVVDVFRDAWKEVVS